MDIQASYTVGNSARGNSDAGGLTQKGGSHMATTKLTIRDGKIVSRDDRYFISLSEDGKRYEGNGWTVIIKDGHKDRPGRIICHAERRYSDGPAICHREFKLADGTIGLAGGNIKLRYAYFRTKKFQEFLNRFGITAVKSLSPNMELKLFIAYGACGASYVNIYTDGDVRHDFADVEYGDPSKGENPSCYEGHVRCIISNATWAIVARDVDWRNDRSYSCILYTMRDVMSLEKELMAHGPKL